MTSHEVARLKRLKLDRLEAPRLREEIAKAIAAFEAEAAAAAEERARLEAVARRLTAEVAGREAERPEGPFGAEAPGDVSPAFPRALRPGILDRDRLDQGRSVFTDPTLDLPRLDRIESDLGHLKALRGETADLRALVEALRAREEQPVPRDIPVLDTGAIFTAVAASLAEAQLTLPEGFALGAVEAEVKGAMGAEGGRVVMGLDAQSTPAAGAVSTLKFTVVPAPRTVLLD